LADNVIHGEGKPRFIIPTSVIWTGTDSAATDTTITLNGSPNLDDLDAQYGLVNFRVWSKNSSSEDTYGKITAYNDITDVLTVDSWSNGTPPVATSVTTFLQTKQIDLPYCQRLTEIFTPDFIVKKMVTGEIKTVKRGFYYSASLDYAKYFHKDEMQLLRDLYNKDYDYFTFYPRVDNPGLSYKVDIDPDSEISFYQLQAHQGHGGVIILINSKTRLDKIPFIDPTQAATGAIADGEGIYLTDDEGTFVTEE